MYGNLHTHGNDVIITIKLVPDVTRHVLYVWCTYILTSLFCDLFCWTKSFTIYGSIEQFTKFIKSSNSKLTFERSYGIHEFKDLICFVIRSIDFSEIVNDFSHRKNLAEYICSVCIRINTYISGTTLSYHSFPWVWRFPYPRQPSLFTLIQTRSYLLK